MKYEVVEATPSQLETLRSLSKAFYRVGLMDTPVIEINVSQLRSAHSNDELGGTLRCHIDPATENPAIQEQKPAKIKPRDMS